MLDPVIDNFPLWALTLLLFATCLVAGYLGTRLRRWKAVSQPPGEKEEKSDAEAYIIGSIFGLLAFFLAMTFSIASDRYSMRRDLVYDEANAISTTYMRLNLFDQPAAAETRELMRQYTHTRIAPDGLWGTDQASALKATRDARERAWARIRAALLPWRETDFASNILEPMNAAFDIGTKRELLGQTHIPTRIFDVLFIYTLVSAAVLGFVVGDGGRGRKLAAALLLWLYTMSFVLILDIDRPRAGKVTLSQAALEELAASMDRDAVQSRISVSR
ncbi:MAG TPA: hypothetical protein VNJ05_00385 [Sphingomicrobium sp.]|nr:hypothetical protein [Sphingomicrobium sp.]